MFSINKTVLQQEADKTGAKEQEVRNNPTVLDAIKLSFANLIDTIVDAKTYNAVHWVCNIDRWHNNQGASNTTTYKRGEIVFLDLGAQNFKHEPSYTHACIVLANRYDSVLIVPCSTKQYGTGHMGIINATQADGFVKNTGIQSECFRWVSKNRIVSRTSKQVSPAILNQLDEILVSFSPSTKALIKQKDNQIAVQKEQIDNLQKQLDDAKVTIAKLMESKKI